MRSITQTAPRRVTPGDLVETVRIEREITTGDGFHGAIRAWATVAEDVAALPEPLFVGEREVFGGVRTAVQYRFTLYRRDDVVAARMRIVWNGKAHEIRGVRIGAARELFMEVIADLMIEEPVG